jgi:hypothetical protein
MLLIFYSPLSVIFIVYTAKSKSLDFLITLADILVDQPDNLSDSKYEPTSLEFV